MRRWQRPGYRLRRRVHGPPIRARRRRASSSRPREPFPVPGRRSGHGAHGRARHLRTSSAADVVRSLDRTPVITVGQRLDSVAPEQLRHGRRRRQHRAAVIGRTRHASASGPAVARHTSPGRRAPRGRWSCTETRTEHAVVSAGAQCGCGPPGGPAVGGDTLRFRSPWVGPGAADRAHQPVRPRRCRRRLPTTHGIAGRGRARDALRRCRARHPVSPRLREHAAPRSRIPGRAFRHQPQLPCRRGLRCRRVHRGGRVSSWCGRAPPSPPARARDRNCGGIRRGKAGGCRRRTATSAGPGSRPSACSGTPARGRLPSRARH